MPDAGDDATASGFGSTTSATKERNPFALLGDIAVALTATRPLPKSVEEYGRASEKEQGTTCSSLDVAEAGVLVSVA